MKPQVIRLNESALLAAGIDIVSVKALSEIVRLAGPITGGPTVREVGQQAESIAGLAVILNEQIEFLQEVVQALQFLPGAAQPETGSMDALAMLPPVPVAQQVEHLTTEVRQIAEQVAALADQIKAIQQGTMP